MGKYIISKNSTIDIDLEDDYQDFGWSFRSGVAVHDGCNDGSIYNKVFHPKSNTVYSVSVRIDIFSTGFVEVYLGGVLFIRAVSSGEYNVTAETMNDSSIEIRADKVSAEVSELSISEGDVSGVNIVFDTIERQYNGLVSLNGDMMERFLDEHVVFKDGELWVSNKNDLRNNFFGTQYPSVIRFYCNVSYEMDKDFYSMSIDGNMPWHVDLRMPPREGKGIGQRSRIKSGNFSFKKGLYVSDILRDMNDPRFSNELQALMKGALLQGQYMEVTITNRSDKEVILVSVSVDVSLK